MNAEFSARCPKCDNRSFERPATLDIEIEVACNVCGHHGKLVEFADLATLDALVEDLKRRALKTLRDAGALKPSAEA